MLLYQKVNKWLMLLTVFAAGPAYADLDDLRDLGLEESSDEDDIDLKNIEPDLGSKPSSPPPQDPPAEISAPPQPSPSPSSRSSRPTQTMRTTPDGDKEDRKKPIKWSAKGLKASRDGKIIDLVEDVVVTQGNLRMTAHKAKVFFNQNDEVDRVEADGDVKVNKAAIDPKDRISARGNKAIFYNAQRKVILKGRAALWRGTDVVRGKQISYSLDTGWIKVDNVEGVVQPGEENERR